MQLTIIVSSLVLHAMEPETGPLKFKKSQSQQRANFFDRLMILNLYREKIEKPAYKIVCDPNSRWELQARNQDEPELVGKPRKCQKQESETQYEEKIMASTTWGKYILPQNEDGSPTNLHAAVIAAAVGIGEKKVNYTAIDNFIKLGIDINAKDMHGYTALHYAVAADNDWELVDKLCENNANLNIEGANGFTPKELINNDDVRTIGLDRCMRLHDLARTQTQEH